MSYPKLVAECCCNHMGQFDIALEMIDEISAAKADFAKFQKWDPKEALSEKQFSARHPNQRHSFGEPYGKHRQNLEFTIRQHHDLKAYCAEKGVAYSCSVFDKKSAKEICEVGPAYIKIPSQKNLKSSIYDIVCNMMLTNFDPHA